MRETCLCVFCDRFGASVCSLVWLVNLMLANWRVSGSLVIDSCLVLINTFLGLVVVFLALKVCKC